MPTDRQTPATRFRIPAPITGGATITVVALVLFLSHVIAAAALLDSKTSNPGGAPPIGYTD